MVEEETLQESEEKAQEKENSQEATTTPPTKTASEGSSEEISLDFSKIGKEIKKAGKKVFNNKKLFFTLVLLLIPLVLSVAIRIQPLYLPITDDWAQNSVDSSLRQELSKQVNSQYGNLPEESRDRIMAKELAKYKEENKNNYKQQIDATSKSFKGGFSAPDGIPYLGDIDSYLWLRKAQNILDHGHVGTEMRDGEVYDGYLLAPLGSVTEDHLHPHIIVFFYKIARLFNENISLMHVMFYVPVMIGIFATLFAFLLGRKLSNNVGGFFTAMLIAVHPAIIGRMISTDTDSYTVMFHLLVLWLLAEALSTKDEAWKPKAIYTGFAGVSLAAFGMIWAGWWYIFDLTVAVLIGTLGYYFLIELRKGTPKNIVKNLKARSSAFILGVFVLSTFIFVSLFLSAELFFTIQTNVLYTFTVLSSAVKANLWPNVYTTVAELNKVAIHNILSQLGSKIFVFLSFFGLVFLYLKKKQYMLFAGAAAWYWAVLSIFLTTGQIKGKYLLLLLAIPLGVGLLAFVFSRKTKKNLIHLAAFTFAYEILVFIFAAGQKTDAKVFAALLGLPILVIILMSIFKKQELSLMSIAFGTLLLIWTGAMFYATKNGIRFIIQILIASSILYGIVVGKTVTYIHHTMPKLINKLFNKIKPLRKPRPRVKKVIACLLVAAVFVLFLSMLVAPTKGGFRNGRIQTPIFDDAWYNSLTGIKAKSAPDAIINSWWDFGHYFKAIGDRRVTFDGGTQNRPQAHWVGKVLLTSDEKQAIAILRMLDCGGNTAYDILQEKIDDPAKTIDVLYGLLAQSKEEGTKKIQGLLSSEKANELVHALYCDPPENYFITSEDMQGKGGVWAHFGSWNFNKSKMWHQARKLNKEETRDYMKKEFDYGPAQADALYEELQKIRNEEEANSWVAPWPNYLGIGRCVEPPEDPSLILCQNTLNGRPVLFKINKATMDVVVDNSPQKNPPSSIMWRDARGYHEKRFSDNAIGVSIALLGDNSLLMSHELAGSMFTRLFFYEGMGLNHFDKFSSDRSLTTGKIHTWKVDWDGKK